MLASTLSYVRSNNMWNSATKEFLGSNVPHMAIVANRNEFVDQAVNQVGNTVSFYGGGLLANKAIDLLFKKINPRQAANILKQQWYFLGKSAAIYGLLASYVIASPFIRNYITLHRTKSDSFAEIVGVGSAPKPRNSQTSVEEKKQKYLKQFLTVIGSGFLIAASALGLTQLAISRKLKFGPVVQKIHQWIGLPEGQFQKLTDQGTLLFGALPAYIGLFAGARDKLELKEIELKAAGFGLAFIAIPRTLEWIANKYIRHKKFPVVGTGANMAFLLQLISGIVFYGSIPSVVNLLMRPARAKQAGLSGANVSQVSHPGRDMILSRGMISKRKTFEQYVHQSR